MNRDHRTGLLSSEGLRYMLDAAIEHAVAGKKPLSVIYSDRRIAFPRLPGGPAS